MLELKHAGREYRVSSVEKALAKGIPAAVIHTALQAEALANAETATDALRERLAPRRPAKLIEYRIKAELAAAYAQAPSNLTPEATANLTAEATAGGMTLDELMTLIATKAAGFEQAVTAVAALEAQCEAAITAIDLGAPDYPAQLAAAIQSNNAAITAAEAAASALI